MLILVLLPNSTYAHLFYHLLNIIGFDNIMENIPLYEEYRLIERSENEINGAWRGAHLLLFFLAFVFGSFCTFCFHMLMYLFEEKCVLFPKLLLPSETRHSYVVDYLPDKDSSNNDIPVDFVTTKWKDKSTCYLPTYVPLLSGVCGLVWTAMFLMCSSGNQTLTGLQRSWRILPPIFIFSLALGSLCVYSSAVTQAGLMDLCAKLSEVTGGTSTCSFHINVATLVFEKRIRGVYQAIRLTIVSAWLHTACWLLAAALAVVRVILVIDFRLVRIKAELRGNLEQMMEINETQVRTVSPDLFEENEVNLESKLKSKLYQLNPSIDKTLGENDFYYVSHIAPVESSSTLPINPSWDNASNIESSSQTEVASSERIRTISSVLAKDVEAQKSLELLPVSLVRDALSSTLLTRELGHTEQTASTEKATSPLPSTSKKQDVKDEANTSLSISSSERTRHKKKKSNLKSTAIQTDPERRSPDAKPKVHIADSPIKMYTRRASEDTLVPYTTKVIEEPKQKQETNVQKYETESSSSESTSSESSTEQIKLEEQKEEDSKVKDQETLKEDKKIKILSQPKIKDLHEIEKEPKQIIIKEQPVMNTIYQKEKKYHEMEEQRVEETIKLKEKEIEQSQTTKEHGKEEEKPDHPEIKELYAAKEKEIEQPQTTEQGEVKEEKPDPAKIKEQHIEPKTQDSKKEELPPEQLKAEEEDREEDEYTKKPQSKEKGQHKEKKD